MNGLLVGTGITGALFIAASILGKILKKRREETYVAPDPIVIVRKHTISELLDD